MKRRLIWYLLCSPDRDHLPASCDGVQGLLSGQPEAGAIGANDEARCSRSLGRGNPAARSWRGL